MPELAGVRDARRHGQDDALRHRAVALQRVVDQEAVDAAIAVAHGVHVDETESHGCGTRQRLLATGGSLEFDQAVAHACHVIKMGSDVVDDVTLEPGLAHEDR